MPLKNPQRNGVYSHENEEMKNRHGQREELRRGSCSSLVGCLNLFQGDVGSGKVRSFQNPRPGQNNIIYGEIIVQVAHGKSGPGKAASVQLYSASKINPGEFVARTYSFKLSYS